MTVFELIHKDLDRYFYLLEIYSFFKKVKIVILTQGIWAIVVYRLGSWWIQNNKGKYYLRLLSPLFTLLQKFIEIVTGISIPFSCIIGRGLYIGHFGGIIVGHEVKIGENCNLSQQVTIGQGGRGGDQKSPTIGNFVYIGPGAKIFGGITIGNHVAIGANAVVTEDVPDHAVIAGIPAKIINFNGSGDFIRVRS